MPYALQWEPHGVYKRFSGVVTGSELVQSVVDVASHVKFRSLTYEVSDYLSAVETVFSQDALNEVRAVRIGSFQTNPNIKVAIITLDPQIQQRIYSTIAARLTLHQTRVFSATADADAWLGRVVAHAVTHALP